ncbi:hypothetical protein BX600DRAFT_483986 [Xylariales sp. PMI_506]|nr:hypothetical protein BX600DRAFT_483986 [Xylariales sp. PMI_506]
MSRSRLLILGGFFLFFVIYTLSPWDSAIRSGLRWQGTITTDYFQHIKPNDKWLFKEPKHPINPAEDVAIVIKTGYGTRKRVPKLLKALTHESFDAELVIIQDYPVNKHQPVTKPNGKPVPAVDIIGWMLETNKLADKNSERIMKYERLVEALEVEDYFMSDVLAKGLGWELDAMKFIPGLQYAWENMPKKKWYIMSDDDTYIIKPSLNMLLGHLDPSVPYYIGNPVGDFLGRFAHGGSSVVLSHATMVKLFDKNPKIAAEANLQSSEITFGDKLLAVTLMKIGIYLDESYSRLFNGEPPFMTRMWADRFCLPLISFHGLGEGDLMEQVDQTFKDISEPVYWRHMAQIYNAPTYESFIAEPIRENYNFVGRLDEHSTTVEDVKSVHECIKICNDNTIDCLAWVWDTNTNKCHYAPWAIVGNAQGGVLSGINYPMAQKLEKSCHSPSSPVRHHTAAQ